MRKFLYLLFALLLGTTSASQAQVMSDSYLSTAIQQVQQAVMVTSCYYVDSLSAKKLAEDAIRAMLKELDPHSAFLNEEETKALNEDLGGNFDGIGVQFQMVKDTLLVISTIVGGPSEKAGILANDQIVWVNDTTIAGVKMSNKDIQKRLRGPKGTKVKVTILREGEKIDFMLTRDKIPVNSVDATFMVSPEVGYVKVSRFGATTPKELTEAMQTLEKQGMKHIILDLQGNGGGYLQSAVEMASLFLNRGDLVVYTEGRAVPRQNSYVQHPGNFKGRVVVLIDEESASASEILSGAMQDLDRGVIVGRRSFGKGCVQRPFELAGNTMIKLTLANYYTPSGRCIQKPYEKGNSEDYRKDLQDRYKHGEMQNADSIHFNDSLKYETRNGRTVYGGGGIMPDVFVPLDTLTKLSKTHRDLIAKGTWNSYIIEYFRKNLKKLNKEYPTFEKFNAGFEVSDQMIYDLCKRGATNDSVKIDTTEVERSMDLMKLQMKANIANDLFKEGAYNKIMNYKIPAFLKAIEVISDEKTYRKLLEGKK